MRQRRQPIMCPHIDFDGGRSRMECYSGKISASMHHNRHNEDRTVGTVTKAELASLLNEKVGLNQQESKDMVQAFFEEIAASLEAGDNVKLAGFGNFTLRDKPPRPGRNPKTGEVIPVTARRVTTFRASVKLKKAVETSGPAMVVKTMRVA
jgi:integration host factor subunit alpha